MIDQQSSSGWTPLCLDELGASLRRAVLEIASSLSERTIADPSLTGGPGSAVLYDYLSQALPGNEFADEIEPIFERAIVQIANGRLGAGLYGGASGFGWCFQHVVASEGNEDPLVAIDEVLLFALGDGTWTGPYDLLTGLVGIGIYAVDRLPRLTAFDCLERILDHLTTLARKQHGGIAWWNPPHLIGPAVERYPAGNYDLGAAHGTAGVIAFLGRLCGIPRFSDRARSLLATAVSWLLSQRLPYGSVSCFPRVAGDVGAARMAWCYGDPGIAFALLSAARSSNDERLANVAIEIALCAANRSVSGATADAVGVIDAGLCHGSAGLAHIFNRFYQNTHRVIFADAARYWFESTLALRKPGAGVAGFLANLAMWGSDQPVWSADPGFLTGATGIGLALAAAISDVDPTWDRVLLWNPSSSCGQAS